MPEVMVRNLLSAEKRGWGPCRKLSLGVMGSFGGRSCERKSERGLTCSMRGAEEGIGFWAIFFQGIADDLTSQADHKWLS